MEILITYDANGNWEQKYLSRKGISYMKKFFISKQGFGYSILCIIAQTMLFLPVNALVSFVVYSIILSKYNVSIKVFVLCLIVLDLIWIIRNKIVIVENNKMVLRTFAGTKQVIDFENVSNLQIINSKTVKNKILKSTLVKPLVSNCASIFVPIGNVICFNDKTDRTIMVGVYNYIKLYNYLEANVIDFKRKEISINDEEHHTNSNIVEKYWLSLSFREHIKNYFRNFIQTIVEPAAFSAIFYYALRCTFEAKIITTVFFIVFSLFLYLKTLIVIYSEYDGVIRLNCFIKNQDNLINLKCIREIKLIKNTDKFVLKDKKYSLLPRNGSNLVFLSSDEKDYIFSLNSVDEFYEYVINYIDNI